MDVLVLWAVGMGRFGGWTHVNVLLPLRVSGIQGLAWRAGERLRYLPSTPHSPCCGRRVMVSSFVAVAATRLCRWIYRYVFYLACAFPFFSDPSSSAIHSSFCVVLRAHAFHTLPVRWRHCPATIPLLPCSALYVRY